jgi:hypothetical protein
MPFYVTCILLSNKLGVSATELTTSILFFTSSVVPMTILPSSFVFSLFEVASHFEVRSPQGTLNPKQIIRYWSEERELEEMCIFTDYIFI